MFERAAPFFARCCPGLGIVYASPLRRAHETAELLARAAHATVVSDATLLPDTSPERFAAWLDARQETSVALVGHEPALSGWIGWLLAGERGAAVHVGKGAGILLAVPSPAVAGSAELRLAVTAAALADWRDTP